MTNFSITIENIQHIKSLNLDISLETPGLICIIGKNSIGKTTLFKSILNLIKTNTFLKTSHPFIYSQDSRILYSIDNNSTYEFKYDDEVKTLNYHGDIDESVKNNIYVELPIPFGERFKQYKTLGHNKTEIKTKIALQDYEKPTELINLLNYIYDTNKFDDLIDVSINDKSQYILIPEGKPYIREDYFSSSEYFIVTIYKIIQSNCKLIAIDEIDISLDSNAQIRCISVLRELVKKYAINLFFSTHSLALIKTLTKEELLYMEEEQGICTFSNTTDLKIQKELYGFNDYKEDKDFLSKEISRISQPIIITEGKTDWKHIKKALEIFQSSDQYSDLDIKFLEYNNEIQMGDSQLDLMVESYSKIEQNKKIIFIFDRDNPKYKKEYGATNINNHGNNVFSFCIPKISDELDNISIEFYYKNTDLFAKDTHNRKLFLGTDFYITGWSKCGNYILKEKNKAGKQVIIDNAVYKKDDLKWETSIALSKSDFADHILNDHINFKDSDRENFKLIFEVLKDILNIS